MWLGHMHMCTSQRKNGSRASVVTVPSQPPLQEAEGTASGKRPQCNRWQRWLVEQWSAFRMRDPFSDLACQMPGR